MKSFNTDGWVRPSIRNLVPYSSARDEFSGEDYIFLDANESPFESGLNRYPDPYQIKLRKKIAALKGFSADQLFLGNGSDEAIDLLFRCFTEPGEDRVLSISPSYGMYKVSANINNVVFKTVLLNPDFSLDPDKLLRNVRPGTKMVFLCSPNNPSGNALEEETVRKVLDNFEGLVVIDEAYQDFSDKQGFLRLLPKYQNLVVLQTFSKAWGMAGARMGMAFADPDIISYMQKVKYPYNINRLSQEKLLEALESRDDVEEKIRIIKNQRGELARALKIMNGVHEVYPSDANFILIKVNEPKRVYRALIEKGIVVRDRSSVPLCDGCLRITIGTEEENMALLDSLSIVLESHPASHNPHPENQ